MIDFISDEYFPWCFCFSKHSLTLSLCPSLSWVAAHSVIYHWSTKKICAYSISIDPQTNMYFFVSFFKSGIMKFLMFFFASLRCFNLNLFFITMNNQNYAETVLWCTCVSACLCVSVCVWFFFLLSYVFRVDILTISMSPKCVRICALKLKFAFSLITWCVANTI